MNNIVTCERCRKTLVAEEYENHLCSPLANGSKIIEIDYYIIHSDELGDVYIITKTMDGLLLTLKKSASPTENKHYFSPTESQQRNKTPDGETEPNCLNIHGYWIAYFHSEWLLKSCPLC